MAINTEAMGVTSGLKLSRDPILGATADADINAGATTLYLLSVDNTANAAAKSYFKAWDATAPTVGTTAPDLIIPVPGGTTVTMAVIEGLSFATGFSMACVTAGGTAGTTPPVSAVVVAVVYT